MTPLYIEDIADVEDLEPAVFPLVEDFVVRLVLTRSFGKQVELASGSRGRLAGFHWWDHAETSLVSPEFRIPVGTTAAPFEDVEQGWQILIWERDGWMLVAEAEEPVSRFDRWFRVDAEAYRAAWAAAVEGARQST